MNQTIDMITDLCNTQIEDCENEADIANLVAVYGEIVEKHLKFDDETWVEIRATAIATFLK